MVGHAQRPEVRRQVLLTVGCLAEGGQLLNRRVGQRHVGLACGRVIDLLMWGRKSSALRADKRVHIRLVVLCLFSGIDI